MPEPAKRLYFRLSSLLVVVAILAAIFGAARFGYDQGYAAGQAERERAVIITRLYDVDDLVNDLTFGPSSRDALVDFLGHSVEPTSWSNSGGPGTFSWLEGPPRQLVISHNDDAHRQVSAMLERLRQNKARGR